MEPKTSAIPDSFLSRRKKNNELNIINFGSQARNCIAIARFRSTSFFTQSSWNFIFFQNHVTGRGTHDKKSTREYWYLLHFEFVLSSYIRNTRISQKTVISKSFS